MSLLLKSFTQEKNNISLSVIDLTTVLACISKSDLLPYGRLCGSGSHNAYVTISMYTITLIILL